jgi:hypothetical protein
MAGVRRGQVSASVGQKSIGSIATSKHNHLIYINYAHCLMSRKGLIWSEYMADSHFYALVINHQAPYTTTLWCSLIMSYTGITYTVTQRNTQRCLQPEAKKTAE